MKTLLICIFSLSICGAVACAQEITSPTPVSNPTEPILSNPEDAGTPWIYNYVDAAPLYLTQPVDLSQCANCPDASIDAQPNNPRGQGYMACMWYHIYEYSLTNPGESYIAETHDCDNWSCFSVDFEVQCIAAASKYRGDANYESYVKGTCQTCFDGTL